ncbi:N-glycosylase/DNA lyase [Candidatus Micrarchaeota archaeon]|nr:N-glycosylase/DNA lyase [Candidatus Micrarchaeota archaeon]
MGEELAHKLVDLKVSPVSVMVKERLEEFKLLSTLGEDLWFSELCYCLLTANSSAKKCMEIQEKMGNGFATLPQEELSAKLRELGYRFYNKRAEYIMAARVHTPGLKERINSLAKKDTRNAREWLVENVLGMGYKEASHFLRNVGYTDVAILDRHILRTMAENNMIPEMPKSLNRVQYLTHENLLRLVAFRFKMSLAALDLYLWYLKTGKVLK